MKQDDYKLWTGETVTYTTEDWQRLVAFASGRLASYLCLDALPETLPDDLQNLLANFIAAYLKHQGDHAEVTTKRVRNFSISYGNISAANAFAKIAGQYADIIDKYSNCGTGINVEKNTRCCNGCI